MHSTFRTVFLVVAIIIVLSLHAAIAKNAALIFA